MTAHEVLALAHNNPAALVAAHNIKTPRRQQEIIANIAQCGASEYAGAYSVLIYSRAQRRNPRNPTAAEIRRDVTLMHLICWPEENIVKAA